MIYVPCFPSRAARRSEDLRFREPHLKVSEGRSRAPVGVVLLSVHQNLFCVSTTLKMYTSNVLLCFFFRLAHKLYLCQSWAVCGILFWVCFGLCSAKETGT